MNSPQNHRKQYIEIWVAQHRKIKIHALVRPITIGQTQATKFIYKIFKINPIYIPEITGILYPGISGISKCVFSRSQDEKGEKKKRMITNKIFLNLFSNIFNQNKKNVIMYTIPGLLCLILDSHCISEIAQQFGRGRGADKHSQITSIHIVTISGLITASPDIGVYPVY